MNNSSNKYHFIDPANDAPITASDFLDKEEIDGILQSLCEATPKMRDGNWPHHYKCDVWMLMVERERRIELMRKALADLRNAFCDGYFENTEAAKGYFDAVVSELGIDGSSL